MARPRTAPERWGEITVKKQGTRFTADAYYRDATGKQRRIRRTADTPTAARTAIEDHLIELAKDGGALEADSPVRDLVQEWWEEYLDREPAAGTITRYRGVIDNHILPALGNLTVKEARTPRLNRFLKTLATDTGKSTAAIARVILVGVFGMAQQFGITTANAADGTSTIQKPKTEPRAWTVEEIALIREALKARDKKVKARSDLLDPADFMLGTGARIGEVFALRWDDVDLASETPTVRITATVARDPHTHKRIIQEHTKTRHKRVLALPDHLVAMLLRRKTESFTDLVFPSWQGTLRIPDNYRTQWDTALKLANLPPEMPKTWRSTVATILAQSGVEQAQLQLGHTSLKTTERHYLAESENVIDNRAALNDLV